jgi:hypothetical protein
MDSDGDGLPDGIEVNNGLDPLNPADGMQDADNDGYRNIEEYKSKTDINDAKSKPQVAMSWFDLLVVTQD